MINEIVEILSIIAYYLNILYVGELFSAASNCRCGYCWKLGHKVGTSWASKSGCANRNRTTQKTEGETDGLLVIPLI